ncbi:MAG: carbohydrate porin [Planctomycetota bacterium]|nr:carbohydrate porin [Planctomycetota bacterium]
MEPPSCEGGKWPALAERETLTDNWFSLGERLADSGIAVRLSLTQVYQINLSGGLATHRRAGRHTGSYDLEVDLDLEKLLNIPGGSIYVNAEGSWSDGLDESSVGSVFGVNGDASGCRAIDLAELWYEQAMLAGRLRVRIGKLDLTGGFEHRGCPVAFDCNAFANDESSQFLNGALVNNPTIPFPDKGLGVMVYYNPLAGWYVSAGCADAQADVRETGFNTAFHDGDYFFGIFETGIVGRLPSSNGVLVGAYRAGLWYDPQPKEHFDSGRIKRDDVGFYLSFDQMAWKENADAEDTQGLGLFARYGLAHKEVNEVSCFWSIGAQYQGLISTRDDDVLGFGIARGRLSGDAGFTADCETVLELYYNIAVSPWLSLAPSLQYVCNPGAEPDADDAVVMGFRCMMSL